ncbi:uncharacterized protein LOC129408681 [Boleophthalmus pectinirostris]|uniref:uncharacterized protein LOC129408681 n=1 Tax=Boleophthalmus pectinirostris TaxID=150288 RepID=UPI00242DE8AE|nr:uncharacterized protein LOC129408681 [Boleophthalmus pectinirostris]
MGGESVCVFKDHLNENQADRTPTSRSILDDAGLEKVKRTLNLSEETGKRKKTAEPALKRKPKRKEEMADAVTKAVTRATKKSKVEQELNLTASNRSSLMILNGDDQKSVKAKARTVKRVKSLSLQTSTGGKVESPEALTAPLPETVTNSSKKRKSREEARAEESRAAAITEKTERKTKKTKTAAKDAGSKGRNVTEKVYFEMTLPPENDAGDVCGVAAPQNLQEDAGVGEVSEVVEGGVSKRRTRRTDPQKRKCRVFKSRKVDEAVTAATADDAMFKQGSSTRLLRSQSCPEIPWLRPLDTPWTAHFHLPPRSRSQPPQQQHPAPPSLSSSSSSSLAHHFHRSSRRARRHTVCSLEVEREIAPLCLRKEREVDRCCGKVFYCCD